jgi:hypothetical protein
MTPFWKFYISNLGARGANVFLGLCISDFDNNVKLGLHVSKKRNYK